MKDKVDALINKDFFEITALSREDLFEIGIDENTANKVPDDIMQRIANKMADIYLDNLFWDSLRYISNDVLTNLKVDYDN